MKAEDVNRLNKQNNKPQKIYKHCPNCRETMHVSDYMRKCPNCSTPFEFAPQPTSVGTPRCPTCQSTNIKKISFAKGYLHWRMLGVFSKTAMSQWECKSCGTKF